MTGLNHAVTGAMVAAVIGEPAIALPAAFLSHFVIDMLPHWDYYKLKTKNSKTWANAAVDLILALTALEILILTTTVSPWLIAAGGLLGILPDTMWLSYLLYRQPSIKGNPKSLINTVRHYHSKIQWAETPRAAGLYAEIVWLIFTVYLIYQIH